VTSNCNWINFIVSLMVSMSLSLRTISASSFSLFIISSITSWHQQCHLGFYISIYKKTFNINKSSVLLLDTPHSCTDPWHTGPNQRHSERQWTRSCTDTCSPASFHSAAASGRGPRYGTDLLDRKYGSS